MINPWSLSDSTEMAARYPAANPQQNNPMRIINPERIASPIPGTVVDNEIININSVT